MPVEPGQRLSHYSLVEKIGEGGMGVVYRARDEHLERDVAVKVLAAGRELDEGARSRFRNEALALSRLNHPNIETAHDFDSEEGIDFLVMEYIPGTTLAQELSKGPLPEKEIVRLGIQLTEGLAVAHDRGILHRDLKPNNVRLTPDGRLKILDFGLAKLMQPVQVESEAETLVHTRGPLGTLPYMAPEQLSGEEADARTDLHGAGAVLYEMATGRPPYQENLETALIDAILHQTPVAPRAHNARISPDLERVILKCLDKDPANRYQSVSELGVDLRRLVVSTDGRPAPAPRPRNSRWVALAASLGVVALVVVLMALDWAGLRDRLFGRAAPGRVESLAVLPFANLMDDPDQQYFVDGMHEALIADLTKISALRVISRTSAMQYRDARKPLPEVGRELGVDAIVEGSVLRADDRVRISAQLVHAATDTHLWAESYERDLRDILRLQRDTARAIARQIRVVVTAEEEARLELDRPVDLDAYDAYLKGLYLLNVRTKNEILRSLDYFEVSILKDPSWAPAHAARGEAHVLTGWYKWVPPEAAFPPAKASVDRALALDPASPDAHTVAAAVFMLWDWDLSAAEAEFRRAIELNPNHARAHHWYALFLTYVGRDDEAIAEIRRAQELDPLSIIIHTIAGLANCSAGRYEEAVEESRKTLEMNPDFPLALTALCCGYQGLEMHDEAIAAIQKAVALTDGATEIADLAEAYLIAGQRDRGLELLAELEARAEREYVPATILASIYLTLDDYEKAIEQLEKAYDQRAWDLVFDVLDAPEPLRRDPRFQDLRRRVGLPPA